MASINLPIGVDNSGNPLPLQQFQVELDGTTYTIGLHWNARAAGGDGNGGGWFMDLMDAEENPVLMGRRLVVGWPIWARFRGQPGVPLGQIEAIDMSGQDLEAGLTDLGTRVLVMYTPLSDLTA